MTRGLVARLVSLVRSIYERLGWESSVPNDLVIRLGIFWVRVVRPTALKVGFGPVLSRTFTIDQGSTSMDISLGDNMQTTLSVVPQDAAGLSGTFKTPPTWTVDDASVVKITPAADGLTCVAEAAIPAKLGSAAVTVTDNDDPNLTPFVFNFTVGAENVTHLGGSFTPPVERDAPAPVVDPNTPTS